MTEKFSKRHGYQQAHETEIIVRQDAPHELRGIVVQLAYECGFRPGNLRSLVCRILRKRPDSNNWSEYPNIDNEVHELVDGCDWYRVYDIIEGISGAMRETPYSYESEKFESEMNDYFLENGVGWKLSNGKVEMRGPGLFEEIIGTAEWQLETKKFSTARNELHEARRDLSRRPAPDITGGIQHSMAALECVARETCGDAKATLGDIIKRYPDIVPRPLDEAIAKAWGYASENARHIREGREPTFEEAELVVGMVAALATYLARKHEV
ncbi:MAG: AbiJ-NTD4 domain-containing protein [Acidithiobacillus ferrivorans]